MMTDIRGAAHSLTVSSRLETLMSLEFNDKAGVAKHSFMPHMQGYTDVYLQIA